MWGSSKRRRSPATRQRRRAREDSLSLARRWGRAHCPHMRRTDPLSSPLSILSQKWIFSHPPHRCPVGKSPCGRQSHPESLAPSSRVAPPPRDNRSRPGPARSAVTTAPSRRRPPLVRMRVERRPPAGRTGAQSQRSKRPIGQTARATGVAPPSSNSLSPRISPRTIERAGAGAWPHRNGLLNRLGVAAENVCTAPPPAAGPAGSAAGPAAYA